MVNLDSLVHRDLLGTMEHQDQLAMRDNLVKLVRMEIQEPLDLLELKAARDHWEVLVHRDSRVHRVQLVVQGKLEQPVYRASEVTQVRLARQVKLVSQELRDLLVQLVAPEHQVHVVMLDQ